MNRRSKKRQFLLDPKEPIRFFLNFEPEPPRVTHQEKKFGGVTKKGTPIYYPTPELANARSLLKAKIAPFAPPLPWKCPIQLTTEWSYRRSEKEEKKPPHKRAMWMTTKPDTDNLQKMLKDVMTEVGFWFDDAYVCLEVNSKIYHDYDEKHGILISVINLNNLSS